MYNCKKRYEGDFLVVQRLFMSLQNIVDNTEVLGIHSFPKCKKSDLLKEAKED
jgi:hypothetical protein